MMMNKIKIISLILAVMILAGCTSPNTNTEACTVQSAASSVQSTPEKTAAVQKTEPPASKNSFELAKVSYTPMDKQEAWEGSLSGVVASEVNRFSKDLISALTLNEDFVLSPFSLYMALAAVSGGASDGALEQFDASLFPKNGQGSIGLSDTMQGCRELLALLSTQEVSKEEQPYGVRPDQTLAVEIATLLCTEQGHELNMEYAKLLKEHFDADLAKADFKDPKTVDAINNWANEKTHGLVPSVIGQIDPDTLLVLANSVYFSGKWQAEFNPELTQEETFHGFGGDVPVQMMHREARMSYAQTEQVQAVRLGYHGGAYMDIFLPAEGVEAKEALLASLELSGEHFSAHRVNLGLPKFTVETRESLTKALDTLGLGGILQGGLTEMVDGKELYVSDVFQKAKIEVDEEGTKAAAVTVMMMATTSLITTPDGVIDMLCDRPFAYRIGYRLADTELTLFCGVYGAK